ncbi:Permease YjgP/YjgQ Family Protein [Blattabacterium sp. (Nauphoeta cinerea)]|uniref:LptF/LptG family permease n=1 Tax=Blattabacterium sp. (Nauphoeta cinerea) TaxID=1316444 RepID=UPI0003B089C5|nr:LptF/LptG family permease [Blattabacterium sp. (Nauphoeta cinerea)]AGW86079.1 Permease YjgP/YjgQ Family Protein [Blattabacterium sp. (Nauphoeta cinerea)]
MIIKKLDLYMIRLFMTPFFIIYITIFIIFMIQFFWSQIDELTGKNISIFIILKFILYFGVSIIPLVTPIALLLTSIIIFGDLSENQELIAIKSSGISLFRVMIPILCLTFILSIVLYLFSDFVIPKAKMKAKKLGYQISLTHPSLKLKERIFVNLLPNFFIKIDRINNNYLHNVFIFFYDKNSLINTILSQKGILIPNQKDGSIQLKLINGVLYSENFNNIKNKQYSYQLVEFHTLIQNFKIPSGTKIKNLDDYDFYKTLNTRNLIKKINFFQKKIITILTGTKYIAKLQLELQKKFTFPVTCIIMFLTGAPLGAIIRKGGIGYPTVIALIIFIIYYTLLTITQNKVEKAEICSWIGAWIPNLVFFPVSVWMTYKTVIDDFYI